MNVIIPIILLFALICYSNRNREQTARKIFLVAMFVLCSLLAIRYEFGPDYFSYRDIYFAIQGMDVSTYEGYGSSTEKLFLLFLQLFPNYTSFIFFLTVFWLSAITYFIKKYIVPRYYWFVLVFFVIEPNFLMLGCVAMRTTLCAAMFIIALEFLLHGKRVVYVAIILFASQFHTSILGLVPLVIINTNKKSVVFNSTFCYVMGLIAFIGFMLGSNDLINSLSQYVMETIEDLQRYEDNSIGSVSQSVNTLLFKMMSFAILLYINAAISKESDSKFVILYKIGYIAVLLQLILGQTLISDRFLLCLNPIYVCVLIRSIKHSEKIFSTTILIFAMVISSYMFYSKIDKKYNQTFVEYHSVFSAPQIP